MSEANGHNKNGLPKGWEWMEVKDISESVQYGYTESSSKEAVGPKFLRITDIQNNQVQWDSVPYCSIDNNVKKKYLLKDGDLVFARTGATVGKSFLIKGNIPESVFASYLIRVRLKETVIDKYVYHYFQSLHYWKQITEGQVGIGQPNVNGTKLGQLIVPIASPNEQKQIVSKIEELFSELDKSIEQLKTAQQQLKVYRQSVLKWAFEGKLTNENVKEGELPKNWQPKLLSEVCEVKDGTHDTPKYVETGIPFVTQKNIRESGLSFDDIKYIALTDHEKFYKRSNVAFGDILISMIGANRGMCSIVNDKRMFSIKNVGLIKSSDVMNSLYLLYFLKSPFAWNYIKSLSKGGAQEFVGLTELRRYPIIYCSLEEQEKVIQEIESRLSVADKLDETISNSLQQAETLRQSILKKAFEGKLV